MLLMEDIKRAASTNNGCVYIYQYYPTEIVRKGHFIDLIKHDTPKWVTRVDGEKDLRGGDFDSEEAAKAYAEELISKGVGKKIKVLRD